MKKVSLIIIIAFLSGVFSSGCKKYPEDDRRYLFKSPIRRLSSPSSWKLREYYINGADSTITLCKRYMVTEPGIYSAGYIPFTVLSCSKSEIKMDNIIGSGKMQLINKKAEMNIEFNTVNGNYNPFIISNLNWKIISLTTNYMKLSASILGREYKIVFKP